MRILVVTDQWPHPAHSTRAANVVFFELMRALAAAPGCDLSLLRIGRGKAAPLDEKEIDGLARLREMGVDVRPPLDLPGDSARRAAWVRALSPTEVDYIPEAAHRDRVAAAIEAARPDALFIPWSEWLTALCSPFELIKFAYYGNPPPKNRRAANAFARRHGASRWQLARQEIYDRRFEDVHLTQMRGYQCLGNVAANDASYYVRHGHPNAFYIRNIWIDRQGGLPPEQPVREGPAIIIGNVGRLSATANSHGLELLGRDLLPELRRVMPAGSFEIHLLGAGQPDPAIAPLLDQPEIRIRGFVDDIDREIGEAAAFLCLNNASEYKVGHTRYLHAWSLAAAVVAHVDAALSMPEIEHGHNALLGRDMAEIARHLGAFCADSALRRRIGVAGYATFHDRFTADQVAPLIVDRLRRAS